MQENTGGPIDIAEMRQLILFITGRQQLAIARQGTERDQPSRIIASCKYSRDPSRLAGADCHQSWTTCSVFVRANGLCE